MTTRSPAAAMRCATQGLRASRQPPPSYTESGGKTHPGAAVVALEQLANLVRLMTKRVFEISALAVRNRVHSELLRLARTGLQRDNTAVISPMPTHADIASGAPAGLDRMATGQRVADVGPAVLHHGLVGMVAIDRRNATRRN